MAGLVLEGGGARGSYQIGAWKALRELGIEIDGVAGTSIGAINGAMIIQDDFDLAWQLWYDMCPSLVFRGDEKLMEKVIRMDLEAEDFNRMMASVKRVFSEGGLDVTPLRELIHRYLKEDVIRRSDKIFGFMTVSLTDFKPLEVYASDVPVGMLGDYLMASANLPVFKLERLDGKLYIDGGFYDNMPVRLLTQKGMREIICVESQGISIKQKFDPTGLELTRIIPSENIGKTLELIPSTTRRNLKMGYYDALRVYRHYKGRRNYIDHMRDENFYIERFSRMDPQIITQVAAIMGLRDKSPQRLLFEDLIPKICELLKLDSTASYGEVALGLFEFGAEKVGIDRYQVLSDMTLCGKLLSSEPLIQVAEHNRLSGWLPNVFKMSGLYLNTVREQVLTLMLEDFLKP
jgi:NTE family protein